MLFRVSHFSRDPDSTHTVTSSCSVTLLRSLLLGWIPTVLDPACLVFQSILQFIILNSLKTYSSWLQGTKLPNSSPSACFRKATSLESSLPLGWIPSYGSDRHCDLCWLGVCLKTPSTCCSSYNIFLSFPSVFIRYCFLKCLFSSLSTSIICLHLYYKHLAPSTQRIQGESELAWKVFLGCVFWNRVSWCSLG